MLQLYGLPQTISEKIYMCLVKLSHTTLFLEASWFLVTRVRIGVAQ